MKKQYLFTLIMLLASVFYRPALAQLTTGDVTPDAAVPAPGNCFDNYPLPAVTYGSASGPTILDANGGTIYFNQDAAILGDLLLQNGTFEVTPGVTLTFYTTPINGEPTGRISVEGGATLRISNATIRSVCNSWFGIVLSTSLPNNQLYINNNSRISNAKYAVYLPAHDYNSMPTAFNTYYYIQNSTFSNNLNHIYDESNHAAPGFNCLIEGCIFTSDKMQMLAPYNYVSPTINYITYQALFINPFTYGPGLSPPNSGSVRVNGNIIQNAVYGILNHYGDRDYVYISGNRLLSIYNTGIWTRQNQGVNVIGNTIELNATRSINTSQISPNNNAVGINYYFSFGTSTSGFMNDNRVTGQYPNDQTNYKFQTGIIADQYQTLNRNTLQQLNVGVNIGYSNSYAFSLFDNKFTDCLEGVSFAAAPFGVVQRTGTARCNTFEKTDPNLGTVYGFRSQGNSWLPTLGQQGTPNGNRFSGIDLQIDNSGSNTGFNYYRLNSTQENINAYNGSVFVVTDYTVSPVNYCTNNSTFNGNGVNAARQALVAFEDVRAMMDSVERKQVPFLQQKQYQQQIVAYFAEQNDLAGLERYAASLTAANTEAYATISLYLMETYAARHEAAKSQAIRTALLRTLPKEPEVRNRVLLLNTMEHVSHWPSVGRGLPAADSLALQTIYHSNTSVSEKAGDWLRYYYPHAAPYRKTVAVAAVTTQEQKAKHQVYLESVYPNPAATSLIVAYRLPKAVTTATFQVFDLFTGRQVWEVELPAQSQIQHLDLQALPTGHYSCRIVADGQIGAAQKLTVLK